MTTATSPSVPAAREFDNGEEFLHSLGDVPMSRVIWSPRPGTATEDDLLRFVERDKRLCELIDGTLVEKPMGSPESLLAGWLITYLNIYLDVHPIGIALGAAGMLRMFSGRVQMPDVCYIRNERLPAEKLPPVIGSGPDLAVEVISESNTVEEMRRKKHEYFESGASLMWIIYPKERKVEVFDGPTEQPSLVLDRNGTLTAETLLPGFTVELSKLFSKLPK